MANLTKVENFSFMEIVVNQGQSGRLDQFLAEKCGDLSRAKIQTLIKNGNILVNGCSAKPKHHVCAGELIKIVIPEEKPTENPAEDIPLKVLFEDEHIIVIDKEPGMVVHPAAGNERGTLVNALLFHCKGQLSTVADAERPGIVHRLDKDTSGCIVVAKSDVAHQSLVSQFASRTMEKRYLAVTQGPLMHESGTIFTHIGRHPVNRLKMAVVDPPNGKAAVTDYNVLYKDEATNSWLVLCDLHTGRTHQIRVHMLHYGNPLLGDEIYAKPNKQKAHTGRLMLHAWQLHLTHPVTSKRHSFCAPIPEAFKHWTTPANIY